MSHSYYGENDTTFLHNNALVGDVTIVTKDAEVKVSMKDLLGFVADQIRSERISALESASDLELLGIPKGAN